VCILSKADTNVRQSFLISKIGWIRGGEGNELHDNTHTNPNTTMTSQPTTNTSQTSTTIVDGYELCNETTVYSHWRTVYQRIVRMPKNGKMVTYDVVGQKGKGAAIVFSWNTSSRTATMLREYNPGPHRILYGLAAGLIEEDKHGSNAIVAAEQELEEELQVAGGIWYPLLDCPLAMDKYATTMVYAYLVLDAKEVMHPRPLDEEEDIEIIKNITIPEIMNIIRRGDMNVVGSWAALLAIEKLRELGQVE
jgi:hypothetical protein